MLIVKEILKHGHEEMGADVLLYVKSMAERHGFTVLDPLPLADGSGTRIEINFPLMKDRQFFALLEDCLEPAEPQKSLLDGTVGSLSENGRSQGPNGP